MSSPERAILEGKNLLDRFRSAQADGDDDSSSYSLAEYEKPHDKAIAEGSLLARSYSATKRGRADAGSDENEGLEFNSWDQSNSPRKSNEAVEIIGKIMAELGSIDNLDGPKDKSVHLSERLGRISDMLYSVKSQLTGESNKLDFSPYSNGKHDENSVVKTPGKNDILKNYMRNQLELQESEWESYEEAINSLAEQLEAKSAEVEDRDEAVQRLTDERDDLVSMTTSLGERLQGLGQEKYQLLMEREEWTVERQELINHRDLLQSTLAMRDEELNRSNGRLRELEEEVDSLQDMFRASERNLHDGRRKVEALTNENVELQKALVLMKVQQNDLAYQIEQWEQFEKSKSLEVEHLHLQLDNVESRYRTELQEATERSNALSQQVYDSASASAAAIDDLHAQLKKVSAQAAEDKASMESLQNKTYVLESSRQTDVKDLADALDTAQRYRAQLEEAEVIRRARDDAVTQLQEALRLTTEQSKDLETRANSAENEMKRLQAAFNTHVPLLTSPSKNSSGVQMLPVSSPEEKEVKVLKNYMKNQLELQEAEWENYEETVNTLASQLEAAQQQVDSQEDVIHKLVLERDELLAQLAQRTESAPSPSAQRPPAVNVHAVSEKNPNQPSSARSWISLDSSNADTSPGKLASYQFDYSMFDDTAMADQIEQFKAHVEQQIRVQVSQLQSLQESLSEEKNTTSLLQKQKQTFKSMVENLNAEIDELKARIEDYEGAELELRNEVSNLRVLLAEKEDQLAHITVAEVPATPTPHAADYPRTPEVFEYRSTISNLETNLSRKTTRCDELTVDVARLRAAYTSKSDELDHHKAQFIKIEAELQATLMEKERTLAVLQDLISRMEDQAKDDAISIEDLSSALSSEREENKALNDVLNMIKEKDEATENMLKGMSEQRIVMSTRFVEIESRVTTLSTQLRESESRYEAMVKLLKQTESERDSNNMRFLECKSKLNDLDQTSFHKISEYETQFHRLQRQLEDEKEEVERLKKRIIIANEQADNFSRTASDEKTRAVSGEMKIDELTETVQSLKNQVDRLKRDAESDRREIESLMIAADDRTLAGDESRKNLLAQLSEKDFVIAEREGSIKILQHQANVRCDEITELEGQVRDLKRKIAAGVNDCTVIRNSFKSMATEVSYFKMSSYEQSEALVTRVSGWVSLFGSRLDTICDQVAFLTDDYKEREILMADLKEQLSDSRGYGERLEFERVDLEERLSQHIDALNAERSKVDSLGEENSHLRNQLVDAERRIYHERALVDQSKQSFSGDIHRLAERLENAEKRAQETAAANAKLFANGARGTAYLESECCHLRGLVDHLRLVNAKLQGDAKAANALAAHGRGFENRLKISNGECERLRARIADLEAEIRSKDAAHLAALQDTQEGEWSRQRQYEEEIAQMSIEIAALKTSISDTRSDMEGVEAAKESLERTLRSQIDELSAQFQRSNENVAFQEERATDTNHRLDAVRAELCSAQQYTEKLKQEHMTQINLLHDRINEHMMLESSLQRQHNADENTIRTLETEIEILQTKLRAVSDELSERDVSISRITSRYESVKDELDLLRTKVVTTQSELEVVQGTKEKEAEALVSMKNERDSLRIRISEMESDLHRINGALATSNNKIKTFLDEIDEKDQNILGLERSLDDTKEALQNAESRIEDLEQDVSEYREQSQTFEMDVSELKTDLSSLKCDLDNTNRECFQKTREISSLTEQVQELQQSVKSLTEKLLSEQALRRENNSLLLELGSAERGIVVTMNSFISANNAAEEKRDADLKNMGKRPADIFEDLLASPPPPTALIYATPTGEKLPPSSKPDASKLSFDVENVPYTLGGNHFYGLQASVNALQDFIYHYRSRCSGLEAALGASTSRSYEIDTEFKTLKARYTETTGELSRVSTELRQMEEEYRELHELESSQRSDCDVLSKSNASLISQLRKVKKDILNLLNAESTSKGHAIVEAHGGASNHLLLRSSSDNKGGSRSNEMDIIPYSEDGHSVLVEDLKNTVNSFSCSLEQLSRELSIRDREIRRLESEFDENSVAWEREKSALHSRLLLATEASEEEHLVNKECRSLLQKVSDELDRAKAESSRSASVIKDLESNLRLNASQFEELQRTLQQSERAHNEAVEELHNERHSNCEAINMLEKSQKDIQILRQKIASLTLVIEEKSTEIERLLTSNQSVNEVRQALEIELEQTRRDMERMSVLEHSTVHAEDSKVAYEAERLLAALAATVDHVHTSTQSNTSMDQSMDMSQHSYPSFTHGATSGQSLVHRVDQAVKRLSEMRSWAREEKRVARKLASSNADLERELAALKISSCERIKILTLELEKARAREKNHQDSITVISEKESTMLRLQTELTVLQKELTVYRSTRENDSEIRAAQATDLLSKDSEIARLTREINRAKAENDALQTKVAPLDRDISTLRAENGHLNEQLRNFVKSVAAQQETILRLETFASRYKQEIEDLQKRLLIAASGSGPSTDAMRQNLQDLESSLRTAQETHESYRRMADEHRNTAAAEAEDYRRRIQQLESKLDIQLQARSSTSEEVASLRHELHKAQTQREMESSGWNSSKAKLLAMKSSEGEWKLQLDAASSMLESMEERLNLSESECARLRSQLQSYQDSHTSDYRAQLTIEIDARKRLEVEAGRISSALEKCQRESAATSSKASALRAEGRHVRRCVLDIAEQLQELMSEMRHDRSAENSMLLIGGMNVSDNSGHGSLLAAALGLQTRDSIEGAELVQTRDGEGVHASSRAVGAGVGSGEHVHELTNALDSIRKVITWMKSVSTWRSGQDVEGRARRLEAENARLIRETDNFAAMQQDKSQRLQAEIETLENLLSAARHREASRIHDLDSRKNEIEEANQRDKDALKKIESDVVRTKQRLSEVETENIALHSEVNKLNATSREVEEYDRLRKQLQASRAELQVKNERNASLIETLSSLEVLSRRDSSELSMSTEFSTNGLPNMAYLSSTLGSGEFLKTIDPQQSAQIHEGILQLQRHLSKYRLRAKMFEDMSNIFRSAFLAAVSTHHTTEGGPNSYWMLSAAPYGRIVEVVRKSYEESMSLLEDQVESCLGVIRQNNSYMTELRTRLEDTLRALYRNGRGEPALAGSVESSQQQHIELLSKSLKQAQEKYEANATALGEERRSGRHRHEALVSELSSVVTTCEQAQEQTVKWRDESEILQRQLESANSEISSLKRTIDSLRHGLIETDIELDTVQRLHRRYEHKASVEGDRLRSVSQGHGRPSSLHARSLDGLSAQQIHSNSHYNEDLHESAAFSVNEILPDYSSGISRVSGRGDLSDAVQSALDAAAQLRQRNAASRFELDRLSSSQSSSRMRAREDASVATHATPPRDKRGVMSTTPTSLNLSTGPNSRGIPGQSYSLSSMSPTVGSVAIRSSTNMQQQLPRPQSMSRALGTSSTFSITRESAGSYYGGSPVEAASGSQTYRRKVKATVRRNN